MQPAPDARGDGFGDEPDAPGGKREVADNAESYPADDDDLFLTGGIASAIALCVAVTVLFGVWPAPVLDFAHRAALLFLPH